MNLTKTQFLIEGGEVRAFRRKRKTLVFADGPYFMKPLDEVPWKEMPRDQRLLLKSRTVWTLEEVKLR